MPPAYRFDLPDPLHVALTEQLTAGQRIRRMLDVREILVGLIRGRLRREYPELSPREINLKVLEEIEDAQRHAG